NGPKPPSFVDRRGRHPQQHAGGLLQPVRRPRQEREQHARGGDGLGTSRLRGQGSLVGEAGGDAGGTSDAGGEGGCGATGAGVRAHQRPRQPSPLRCPGRDRTSSHPLPGPRGLVSLLRESLAPSRGEENSLQGADEVLRRQAAVVQRGLAFGGRARGRDRRPHHLGV
ncbi:unnamed protein product, partial [Ectocarpus fasciculatus]